MIDVAQCDLTSEIYREDVDGGRGYQPPFDHVWLQRQSGLIAK